MISVQQYLFSVSNAHGLTRTLGEIDVCRDPAGRMCYTSGNSAVVFKVMYHGKPHALRCYTHPGRSLAAIYGERLLREELFVYRSSSDGEWVDVVLDEWIEGQTLHERILQAGTAEMGRLAGAFDALASELLSDDRAHGDLKPENIIVRPDGTMQPIDLDASFLPCFAGMESPELGTAAFQHPARTAADFDARLDDFPAALISTGLHALAIAPSLTARYDIRDMLMIDPHRLPHDPALNEILALFEAAGMARQYRIARMLLSPSLRLPRLPELFQPITATDTADEELELFSDNGSWGYRNPLTNQTKIPPLYDCGFDFTEGLGAVQLGRTWHYIDTQGNTVIRCPGCQAVKPFRNTKARILHAGVWKEIGRPEQGDVLEY